MDPAGRRRIGETALEVTSLGMGGAAIGNLYAPVAEETALDAVASALEAELGFFATAPLYKDLNGENLLAPEALERQSRALVELTTRLFSDRTRSRD